MAQSLQQELDVLRDVVQQGHLRAALQLLNQRTSFRYTALFSCSPELLQCVAFYDRWDPGAVHRPAAPMNETYCSIVDSTKAALEVVDGRELDSRFPWMAGSPVVSYCGAPVRDDIGQVIGTVCHFDLKPCQAASTELPLLTLAASLFAPHLARFRDA